MDKYIYPLSLRPSLFKCVFFGLLFGGTGIAALVSNFLEGNDVNLNIVGVIFIVIGIIVINVSPFIVLFENEMTIKYWFLKKKIILLDSIDRILLREKTGRRNMKFYTFSIVTLEGKINIDLTMHDLNNTKLFLKFLKINKKTKEKIEKIKAWI